MAIHDGSERTFENKDCNYGYRESIFKTQLKNKYIVVSVVYKLNKKPSFNLNYGNLKNSLPENPSLSEIRNTIIKIREEKLPDPKDFGNAGSFFMNPVIRKDKYEKLLSDYPDMPFYKIDDENVKIPAAYLIEKCGWKGKSFGGARVYEKQPLVIINSGNAVANDIISLSDEIISSVNKQFGIKISPEVNFI